MVKYKIIVKKSVAKDLRPLPKKDVAVILKCIESLKEEPRPFGCEKLSGQARYRIRKGIYRIIYEIQNDVLVVIVVKVGHRKEIYRTS
jgi:mRNA interferase RelE/StbE